MKKPAGDRRHAELGVSDLQLNPLMPTASEFSPYGCFFTGFFRILAHVYKSNSDWEFGWESGPMIDF